MERRELFSGRQFLTLVADSSLSSPMELLEFRDLRCSANRAEGTSRSEIKQMGAKEKGVRGKEIINAYMCPGLESIDFR